MANTESVDFIAQAEQAEGNLIPLSANTALEGLHMAVRHVRNPFQEPDTNAQPDYYGWTNNMWAWNGDDKVPQTGIVTVDAYIEASDGLTPIGHMDWWLLEDYANGGGNEHRGLIARTEHERKALDRWKDDSVAFKVDYDYHHNGLGSLMLATSARVLPALGITKFYSGCLLKPAQKTYARFDIDESKWGSGRHWSARNLPIEHLAEHPRVEATISQFV